MGNNQSKSKKKKNKKNVETVNDRKEDPASNQKSTQEISSDIDLSVFKNEDDSECGQIISDCPSINRLAAALKYYEMLKIMDNENHREFFLMFMKDIYHQLLDDNNHLMTIHNEQMHEIKEELINSEKKGVFAECNMSSCAMTERHFFESGEKENRNGLEAKLNFYVDILDSIHFYLFHCYDAGFRVTQKDENEEKCDFDDDKQSKQYFDAEFARISRSISDRSHLTKSFKRISTKNKKFNININLNHLNDDEEDQTYLDQLFKHLISDHAVTDIFIAKLRYFVETENYDTDSVQSDNDITNGNIEIYTNNMECTQSLKRFIKETKRMIFIYFLSSYF